jgi:CO/xanthine dehydrogenase FAD-binding subunit
VTTWDYARADDVAQALQLLRTPGKRVKLMAGGTDVQPGIRQGVYAPELVVDISRTAGLGGIAIGEHVIRVGAAVTLSELAAHERLRELVPGLCEAADLIATRQIRNVATVAGDLSQEKRCWFFRSALPCYKNGGASCPCYAVMGDSRHHAILGASRCAAPCVADLAPALTALNATVIVRGQGTERRVPMSEFYRWSGETTVSAQEIIVAVEVPRVSGATQAYEKYAQWRGDFPEASAGVRLVWQGDSLREARISLGGVSPLPMRAVHAERALLATGTATSARDLTDERIAAAARKVVYGALPLRDNAGKVDMVIAVTARALRRARDARHT